MCDLYSKAAVILEKLAKKQGSIKSLTFGNQSQDSSKVNKKQLFALACETLKYKDVIDQLLQTTPQLLKETQKLNHPFLIHVLIYELLFGATKKIKGGGKVKRLILDNLSQLEQSLKRLKAKKKVADNKDLLPEHIRNQIILPRYLRVNTLKTTIEDVRQHLQEKYKEKLEQENHEVTTDAHIPLLLILPSKIDLHEDEMLLSGSFIIQDKSSCMPPFVLQPLPNSHVIDACAAPGNKTSFLAALMNNTGKIFAFEKDRYRAKTLAKMTSRAGCTNIEISNSDFLQTDPLSKKYAKVEYVLADPSCSGSGIVNRLDHLSQENDIEMDEEGMKERLQSLANFQTQIVLHAMKFPSVKRVVYSTCSIHDEENEMVVKKILDETGGKFKLVKILESWPRRGNTDVLPEGTQWNSMAKSTADCCIRTDARFDNTNGFFVSCFERTEEHKNTAMETNTNENSTTTEEQDEELEDASIEHTAHDDKTEQHAANNNNNNTQQQDTANGQKKKKKKKKKKKQPITNNAN